MTQSLVGRTSASRPSVDIIEASGGRVRTARVVGQDCYIPLGPGADAVLVSEADIEQAARALLGQALAEAS